MADPMRSLVLCMVLLSLGAGALAGVHYVTIDLPAQKIAPPPQNGALSTLACDVCMSNCRQDDDYYFCVAQCDDLVCSTSPHQ